MFTRCTGLVGVGLLLAIPFGCAPAERLNLRDRTGGSAALYGQFRAYDGHTGRPLTFRQVLRRCGSADVILFGEEHSDVVCNQVEAQILYALAAEPPPVALALEFFEVDTQASLDAYLSRRIDEPAFRAQTHQGRAYVLAHRPLIELCRAANIPVLAANAPRRLVRGYRKSGLDYGEFRAGADPADQRWLPLTNTYLTGDYEERFLGLMAGRGGGAPESPAPTTQATSAPTTGPAPTSEPAVTPASQPESAPVTQPVQSAPDADSPARLFWSQLLWDEAMAGSLASFRTRFPTHRVMLVVGAFHVADRGGTAIKFGQLRPHDRVLTVIYRSTTDGQLKFDADDRDAGDVVICGIVPPPEIKEEGGGPPATTPASMPATMPTTASAPASMPTTATAPVASD